MTPELDTERLLLHPLELADAVQTQPLFSQWEIVKFLNASVPWPYPADGAHQFYRDVVLPAVARDDEWDWSLRLKTAPAKIIGAISLIRGERINRGFWIALPWQGQGLMTEAVYATNDFWFDVLGFPVLRAPKAVDNAASRRVSEKTGMRVVAVEERDFVTGRVVGETWEITAAEWREFRSRKSAGL